MACVAAALGYSAGGNGHQDMERVQIAPAVTSPAPVASTGVAPETLLRQILKRVDHAEVLDAKIVQALPGAAASETESLGTTAEPAVGPFLEAVVRGGNASASAFKGIWVANLIGGALSDGMAEHQLAPLRGIHVLVQNSDGTRSDAGSGIGRVVPFQQFTSEAAAALTRRVKGNAERLGLRVRSVAILSPVQNAPEVVAQTSEPKAEFIREAGMQDILSSVFGDTNSLEGCYLEVVAPDGEPLLKLAVANRSGIGQSWVNPKYHSDGLQR